MSHISYAVSHMIAASHKKETLMSNTHNNTDHNLPVFGTVYAIPADTHADLDLQDDKEQVFSNRRSQSRRTYSSRKRS